MAYVEVWKSGRLLTRRRVDEEKARKGCRIRLGPVGEVRIAIGQSETLGKFEVCMYEGEPPLNNHQIKETASILSDEDQRLPPLSVRTPDIRPNRIDLYPHIEGYKIIELLGEGGMGMVFRAEQISTKRQVALKWMTSYRALSPKAQAYFQREVELTARLNHPNITRIYESGLHQGMYYYAMELVDGITLDKYVESKKLSQEQILAIMQTICQAVLFAHLRAVIHRDLKPSNIIVSADGQPHVLDFGLAKGLLEEEEAITISVEGQIAGTPAYMSPEQASGHHSQLDTRTDVFSLGVILYELLTGQSPHDLSGSMFEVLYRIMEGKIRRPSKINKTINRELEAILLKARANNPEDRYASAGVLAKDIDNYLNGEPLDARMHTISYFLSKKVLKYRVQVAAGLVISLVLLGIILVAYTKIVTERAISESKDWEIKLKSSQLTWRELELKALSENEQEARAALRIIRDEYISAHDEISELNNRLGEREIPVVARRINLEQGVALAPTALVRKPFLPGGVASWTFETQGHRGPVARLSYSSDGNQLMSAGKDGTVRTWDAESGQLTKILIDPNGSIDSSWFTGGRDADYFSWSVDKSTRTMDEVIKLWGVDVPSVWQLLIQTATCLSLSPDRTLLAFGDRDGTIRVLNTKFGQPHHTNLPSWCGPLHSVCFSPDGNVLATCSGSGTVCIWDAHRWQPLRKFETDRITGNLLSGSNIIAWDSGNTLIARPNNRLGVLEIMDSQSGQVLHILSVNNQRIVSISWSPDGTLLAAGTTDGKAHLWDIKSNSNKLLITFDAHVGTTNAVVWRPDDLSLITAGEDGKIKFWEPYTGKLTAAFEKHTSSITCLALSPNSKVLASGSRDGTVRIWDIEGNRTFNLLINEPNNIQAKESVYSTVAWSPDGKLLASGNSLGNIQIWNPNSRQLICSFGTNCGSINSLAWSADSRILICGGADGTARAWDAKNDFQEHVVLLPLWGSVGPGVAINREGDYRGPPGIAEHIFYVVSTKRGQETISPADFKSRFGWVNEPWQVGLYAPGTEEVQRIYVKADAQPPYNGISWDTAFNDLQGALKLAQPNTEIWVAAGTYRPDLGTGAREASFRLKNGVRLFGGFAGMETDIDLRDLNRNETILSGDLKGDDKPNFTNYDDNSYHVVVANNTDSSTVLDGFVIRGGNANGPGPKRAENTNHHGGGLLVNECTLTLIRCTFRHNSAIQNGGGMCNIYARPIIQNCVFTDNKASCGGAISSDGSKAIVTGCIFKRNSGDHYGGGVNLAYDSSTFLDCTFTGNSVTLYLEGGPSFGGGLCIAGQGNTILTNCRFLQNSSDIGGGVLSIGSDYKFNNCLFYNNVATGNGAGVNNVYNHYGGNRVLSNCTIIGNKSRALGCGIYSDPNCSPVLANCIVWNNTNKNSNMGESEQVYGGSPVINNCCIQGWTGKLGGTGNFGLDPLFVDLNGPDGKTGTLDDNLRLDLTSPCRNAGENSAIPADTVDLDKDSDVNEPIPFDIDGNPRVLNGVVDIGAYESG